MWSCCFGVGEYWLADSAGRGSCGRWSSLDLSDTLGLCCTRGCRGDCSSWGRCCSSTWWSSSSLSGGCCCCGGCCGGGCCCGRGNVVDRGIGFRPDWRDFGAPNIAPNPLSLLVSIFLKRSSSSLSPRQIKLVFIAGKHLKSSLMFESNTRNCPGVRARS